MALKTGTSSNTGRKGVKQTDRNAGPAQRRDSDKLQVGGELGSKIRKFREHEQLSLSQASALTGIPAATLSRVETNKQSPTFPLLMRILSGLNISWADIVNPSDPKEAKNLISVSTPGQVPIHSVQGYTYWTLHPKSQLGNLIRPVIMEVSAEDIETAGGLEGHEGIECSYVLSGTIVLYFEDRDPYELTEGSSAMFPAKIPHCYVRKGRKNTRVLNIVADYSIQGTNSNRRLSSGRAIRK